MKNEERRTLRTLPAAILHSSLYILHLYGSRSLKYQSATLRTSEMLVRIQPGVPFRRVSPTTRGAPLRTERLGVEIPHAAPIGVSRDRTLQVSARFNEEGRTRNAESSRRLPHLILHSAFYILHFIRLP